MRKPWFRIGGLILGALIFTLIVLEGGLRLGGTVLVWQRERLNRRHLHDKNATRILCVGESTTFLGGEDAYPRQLERILNQRWPEKHFTVINKGLPGISSNVIVRNLENWIQEYHPDMVVAMLGINDPEQETPLTEASRSARGHLFNNWRIVKLARLIKDHWRHRYGSRTGTADPADGAVDSRKYPMEEANEETPRSLHAEVIAILKNKPPPYLDTYALAILLESRGRHRQAETLFRQLKQANLHIHANNFFTRKIGQSLLKQKAYDRLSRFIQETLTENPANPDALKWLERLLDQEPTRAQDFLVFFENALQENPDALPYYDALADCARRLGLNEKARRIADTAAVIRSRQFSPFTQAYYLRLHNILRQHGIQPVYVQYPLRKIEPLKAMLNEVTDTRHVIFVENFDNFRSAIQNESYSSYFTDRFAGNFGHATPKGNRLLAETIAEHILAYFKHSRTSLPGDSSTPAPHPDPAFNR